MLGVFKIKIGKDFLIKNKKKMKKETAYKIEHNNSFCILLLLSDALDLIKNEIENYDEGEETSEFKLSVIEMTEEEINNLGEFDGFD